MTTQTKWTPGPWTGSGTALVVKQVKTGNIICDMVEQGLPFVANARLIAAAPEMAEALAALFRECAMIHRFGGDASNAKAADEAQSKARALVARLGAV